ncbi:MAG: chloride channel protein [Acidimicrobiia bacterium]|nr:chloride channel protein [Acidimicrobiia bacterium]
MSDDRSADEQLPAPLSDEPGRTRLAVSPVQRQLAIRVGAASVIGVITGIVVLALEHAVDDVLEVLFEQPAWVPAAVVVSGLLVTALLVQTIGGRSSATTELYVEEYHRREPSVETKHAPGRLLAAFTTLASGGPLGMEGPAVYTGTAVAAFARQRWAAVLGDAYHAMLIAGAAAGIAAVFKAPAAGAIFAMEVPFRGRLAGERILPAIFGSATGYLTMASIDGVKPEAELPLVELTYGRAFGSVILGVIVGVAAIGVIALVERAEHVTTTRSPWVRAVVAGLALATLYAIGRAATDEPVALASGNSVIDWAIEPDHAVGLLVLVFVLRAAGPAIAIAGGGVGGLFIPLMAAGAVIGRLFADALGAEDVALYVIVGASTMLGAGYAVPLTAVVFVAEYTGQAGLIVPGLLAVATMRLVVGRRSVSPAQRP